MQKINYAKIFAVRAVVCFIIIISLCLSTILRVAVVSTSDYGEVANTQAQYRIVVGKLRGTIYDCNMTPITNANYKTFAAIPPTPQAIMQISSHLQGNDKNLVLENLKDNVPAVCSVNEDFFADNIITTNVYENATGKVPACHIIGYTDSSGHGVTGLQKAYDDLLYSDKCVSAVFEVDGKGNCLYGTTPYFENDNTVIHNGVITTIDLNMQTAVENALAQLTTGCAIVSEVDNGKIRAIASVPTFDLNNLSASLSDQTSPMINRALCNYNVGSVFKPIIAAAAIEYGFPDTTFNCTGSMQIADRVFRCHKLDGHSYVDMCKALSQSCNCYFYNISSLINTSAIYEKISSLSINSSIRIADNMYTADGNLPQKNTLNNSAALANLAIGQGNLLASPVAMLNLYSAIAGDGSYYLPSIVEGIVTKSGVEYYDIGSKTKVMQESTAQILQSHLKNVIIDGTGKDAQPSFCTAAGKTATAQTGRYYENGTEITNSWFCGFFPSSKPEYVVIVMSDSRQVISTASIFAQIVDDITKINLENRENDD